ncbi:Histone-lysine N-methyltransferase EHMT1 [Madurella mycetomatis]|uniref:Histone-lysine N-methyltransferase EHMT1 n=1 Tax=Madurella mycetomatis TaxID=100816 RepID=A0A175W7H4_9PEZI|nr:Histone-lysine N-methyltransferase EHMT1 [Madurella mycetomatis]
MVGLLINGGASIESTAGEYRSTPLILAAERGDVATVKVLLETGANIEAQDSDGKTPLILATMNRHEAVVELLLEKGAQVNVCCDSGRYTPLLIAASHGHLALVKLLLERGAKHEPGGDCDAPLLAHVELQQVTNGNQQKKDEYGAILKLLVESGNCVLPWRRRTRHKSLPFSTRIG